MKRASPFSTTRAPARAGRVALLMLATAAAQNAIAQSTIGQTPHPAVVRIVVPEGAATAYGSGTLVDVRGRYGLVVTNWHVVRDATGQIDVIFPDGFRSAARALKVDADWDLAALVIWRPRAQPVPLAAAAPRQGEVLTIAGYGQGIYRQATGRCTQYLAPRIDFPSEMVELDVEARQGDSGGPIFNQRGELAGVLFGAGRGTTTGSYAGRVSGFLASVAPDLGAVDDVQIAAAFTGLPDHRRPSRRAQRRPSCPRGGVGGHPVAGRSRLAGPDGAGGHTGRRGRARSRARAPSPHVARRRRREPL